MHQAVGKQKNFNKLTQNPEIFLCVKEKSGGRKKESMYLLLFVVCFPVFFQMLLRIETKN